MVRKGRCDGVTRRNGACSCLSSQSSGRPTLQARLLQQLGPSASPTRRCRPDDQHGLLPGGTGRDLAGPTSATSPSIASRVRAPDGPSARGCRAAGGFPIVDVDPVGTRNDPAVDLLVGPQGADRGARLQPVGVDERCVGRQTGGGHDQIGVPDGLVKPAFDSEVGRRPGLHRSDERIGRVAAGGDDDLRHIDRSRIFARSSVDVADPRWWPSSRRKSDGSPRPPRRPS